MANYSKTKSLYRLFVHLKNGQKHWYYSMLYEDRKGQKRSLFGMKHRLLDKKHKGEYQTAIFYNNPYNPEADPSDNPIMQFVNGQKIM